MAEEPQVPVWVVGMTQPFPHEHEMAVDPVAGDITCFRDRLRELLRGFRRQSFVRVENEDPVMAERQVLERPVFFLRPGAVELELHDLCATLFRDRYRPVGAL